MDVSNSRSPPQESTAIDGGGDWRDTLVQPAVRYMFINEMVDKFIHISWSPPNEILELVEAFERNAYYAANLQVDYMTRMLSKISSLTSRNYPKMANVVVVNLNGWWNLQDPDGGGDSRAQQLPSIVRDTLIKKFVRILISCGHADNGEIPKIARMFEEKIYYAAYNQSDYLRRMSMKIMNLELKYQNLENDAATNSSSARILQEQAELQMVQSPSHVSAAQGGDGDWRDKHLTPSVRKIIFNRILELLQELSSPGPNIVRNAREFEERLYNFAYNQDLMQSQPRRENCVLKRGPREDPEEMLPMPRKRSRRNVTKLEALSISRPRRNVTKLEVLPISRPRKRPKRNAAKNHKAPSYLDDHE